MKLSNSSSNSKEKKRDIAGRVSMEAIIFDSNGELRRLKQQEDQLINEDGLLWVLTEEMWAKAKEILWRIWVDVVDSYATDKNIWTIISSELWQVTEFEISHILQIRIARLWIPLNKWLKYYDWYLPLNDPGHIFGEMRLDFHEFHKIRYAMDELPLQYQIKTEKDPIMLKVMEGHCWAFSDDNPKFSPSIKRKMEEKDDNERSRSGEIIEYFKELTMNRDNQKLKDETMVYCTWLLELNKKTNWIVLSSPSNNSTIILRDFVFNISSVICLICQKNISYADLEPMPRLVSTQVAICNHLLEYLGISLKIMEEDQKLYIQDVDNW